MLCFSLMSIELFFTIGISLISITLIAIGSNLIVNTISELARRIKISPFILSFVILGALTSVTEMSVALNSYINKTPEVSVGNLLGGIVVMFLFVIPVLAITGNGIKLGHQYNRISLFVTLGSFVLPAIFFLDSYLQFREAIFLLAVYVLSVLLLFIGHKNHSHIPVKKKLDKWYLFVGFFKVIIGGILLLLACDTLINEVLKIANSVGTSPFIISFLALSVGTNLPELSLVIRSVINGKKDIAFGNYLGSAAFNLVILAALAIANNRILVDANFLSILIFTIIGLGLFYIFILTKNNLSRREGLIILSVYIVFLAFEIFTRH
jgi:cation:H+ antiporter